MFVSHIEVSLSLSLFPSLSLKFIKRKISLSEDFLKKKLFRLCFDGKRKLFFER